MTAQDAAELLDLIAARAPALRIAGVLRVELKGVAFTLARPDPPDAPASASAGSDDEAPTDALHDPATWGQFGDDAPRRMPRRTRTPLLPETDQ